MKKSLVALTLSGVVLALTANLASAQTADPGVNKRQHRQAARIAQGVKSGELTRSEARALRSEERAIRAEEREFKSDGKLTQSERRELHRDLNEASRDIYREKHDAQTR